MHLQAGMRNDITRLRLAAAALLLASVSTASTGARADLGPKPKADFAVKVDNGAHVTEGALLMCGKNDCSDAQPLEEVGPQRIFCTETGCHALAYGFAPYLQLRLILSDGRVVTSQVFTKDAFDAEFTAIVTGDTLRVEEKTAGAATDG